MHSRLQVPLSDTGYTEAAGLLPKKSPGYTNHFQIIFKLPFQSSSGCSLRLQLITGRPAISSQAPCNWRGRYISLLDCGRGHEILFTEGHGLYEKAL